MKAVIIFVALLVTVPALGQVDQIKQQSASNASRSSGGDRGSSSGGGGGSGWFFFRSLQMIAVWQGDKLSHRDSVPQMVSLELLPQFALQPSSYYLILPRVRGNWGLFSTDFRVNYLLQENAGSWKDLTTLDWQVLELNMITSRTVTGRGGVGMMRERFGANQSYFEATAGLQIHPPRSSWRGGFEYRVAKDYNTQATPRREVSLQIEKKLFDSGRWHGALVLGGIFQQYYSTVNVWAVQTGFAFRIF